MSSIKIKDLPEKVDTLDDDDLMLIEDAEDTKKISLVRLRSGFSIDGILTSVKKSLQDQIDNFVEKHSQKYQELSTRNENLEVICHNLQNDHDHDAQRIFELEDRLVIQEQLMATLDTERTRLFKLISQLEIDKDALVEDIVILNKTVSKNDSDIIVLQSKIKDLQLKCKEIKELNDDLQKRVTELEKSSSEVIDDYLTKVDTKFDETINDLIDYIKYYHPDLDISKYTTS